MLRVREAAFRHLTRFPSPLDYVFWFPYVVLSTRIFATTIYTLEEDSSASIDSTHRAP
ncbi:uncharacterized protein BDR25DRAFT_1090 [Lindgomyces ingoldianus]|uniref:Uncharacterized protein n=1 Tax=Lindgomyces ingoldianus TaxID=673940 RepID=A0ACB6REC2_9PLEO|nr:uncharacterized protein BDR25DRAFT_1090 [Lindgomyces ingoldianus]KAF2477467.1 hypothetical protein BDR25DRAFT_1090 [Lindgomyces ingoldianus]